MKKVVFTLGAVTAVCACGLVIDPDKLVEGNASTIGGGPTDAPADAFTPDNDSGGGGSDAANDVATDAPVFEVPECVPSLPSGAQGPYAVVTADATEPAPACPAGYLPTPVAQGKSSPQSNAPAECNSLGTCACGSGTGTPKCGLRVRYYDTSTCTGPEANGSTSFGMCNELETENYLKLEYSVSGVTCGAGTGTTSPTAKSTPSYRTQFVVCAPDPAVKTALCKGSDIALPQAKNADACVIVPINQSCFGSEYDGAVNISKAGTFTDGRGCSCQCTGAQSNCSGGAATTHTFLFCGGTSASLDVGACTARGANMEYIQTSTPPSVVGGTPTCSPRATPTGEASPNYDLKLCCLSGGSN